MDADTPPTKGDGDHSPHSSHRFNMRSYTEDKIQKLAEAMTNSFALWGQHLPAHYDILGKHRHSFISDAEDDHLFGSNHDPNESIESTIREYVFSTCESIPEDLQNQPVSVYLEVDEYVGNGTDKVLKPGDIKVHKELIAEMDGWSNEMKERFVIAITKELDGLCQLGAFKVEVMPPGRNAIDCKLVLKVKLNADGSHAKDKARLVAKGFMAKIGLDFYSVFSPMAMLNTARTLLAVAVKHGTPVAHADVPMAFIQSEIDRMVSINLPKGTSSFLLDHLQKSHPGSKVAIRLIKALYGLKQSPALWNAKVDAFMRTQGFERCTSDSCLYKWHADGKWVAISVSVDDLLITGTDENKIRDFRKALEDTYGDCTWNDSCSSFLGIDLKYNPKTGELILSCPGKIKGLFEKFPELNKLNGSRCPYAMKFKTLDDTAENKFTAIQEYIKAHFPNIVGILIYMSITCRADITTITNKSCKGMHLPLYSHVVYLEQVLKYLKETVNDGLCYKRSGSGFSAVIDQLASTYIELAALPKAPVIAFSDANFADGADPKLRSTSGVTIFVFNCLVCWGSKRQTLTARSTFEAELIAASVAADEAAWFHSLQSELPFIFAPDGSDILPIPLLIDNLNALNIANHPKQTPASKHVKLREFRIQDHAKANTVRNLWVPTPLNVSDFFTKPMGPIMFLKFKGFIGMDTQARSSELSFGDSFFTLEYGQTSTFSDWDFQLLKNNWSWVHD